MNNNKILKRLRRIYSLFNEILEETSAFFHWIVILIVVFISTQAISFCIVYIQLLNKEEIWGFLFKYINIWDIISNDNISNKLIYEKFDSVKLRIEFLMNVSIALSGILLSVVTFISYFRKNIHIKKRSCFRKKEIFKKGSDDVKIMCNYFTGANFVVIFSSTFGWIDENNTIREILTKLSKENKLKLYTGDNIDTVKKRLETYDSSFLNCIQKTDFFIRFSYIERDNTKYLLYCQEEEERTYVVKIHENAESQYLLQVISHLVK